MKTYRAKETARKLNMDLEDFDGEELARVESALVKMYLRCRKKKW